MSITGSYLPMEYGFLLLKRIMWVYELFMTNLRLSPTYAVHRVMSSHSDPPQFAKIFTVEVCD